MMAEVTMEIYYSFKRTRSDYHSTGGRKWVRFKFNRWWFPASAMCEEKWKFWSFTSGKPGSLLAVWSFCAIRHRRGREESFMSSASLAFPSLLSVFLRGTSVRFSPFSLSSQKWIHRSPYNLKNHLIRNQSGKPTNFVFFESRGKFVEGTWLPYFLYFCAHPTLGGLPWLCITEVRMYLSSMSVSKWSSKWTRVWKKQNIVVVLKKCKKKKWAIMKDLVTAHFYLQAK